MAGINKKKILIILAAFFMLVCSSGASNRNMEILLKDIFGSYSGDYIIHVDKTDFSLSVYDRGLRVIKKYKIGYGLNPDKKAKLYSGDERTPEGVYKITEVLSADADKKSEPYKKLKEMNSVHFRAKDGHHKFGKPDEDLGAGAYGLRFFRIDYPDENDRKRYIDAVNKGLIPMENGRARSIGGGIAIHGNNDPASIGQLCSSGCVRMYNEDIVELNKFVDINTPVIISGM